MTLQFSDAIGKMPAGLNVRTEGKEDNTTPAVDIFVKELRLSAEIVNVIAQGFSDAFYDEGLDEQRLADLYPLCVSDRIAFKGTMTVDGRDFEEVVLSKFELRPLPGGVVSVKLRAQYHQQEGDLDFLQKLARKEVGFTFRGGVHVPKNAAQRDAFDDDGENDGAEG